MHCREILICGIMGEQQKHRISRDSDAIWCSRQATVLAQDMGFDTTAIWEIAISVSELVTNVLKYAGTGSISIRRLEEQQVAGIEIIVEDEGPGIADIESAIADGYTEGRNAQDIPIADRRGLGSGLGAVQRLMDDVRIENRTAGGVKVTARKNLISRS